MYKKLTFLTLGLLLGFLTGFGQTPDVINYQGVAHQINGNPIANQAISIRLSVHHATLNGAVQYSESRTVTTDGDGLFNLQIGSAGALSTTGSWSAITWDNGAKYLQVEMDAAGGSNYTNMGTQQLVSVPYAQHAKQAASLLPTATITPAQLTPAGAVINDVLQFDGTHWIPGTIAPGSLSLPYNVADPNLISFAITNSSASGGTAMYGKTTTSHVNATGVRGESTGANGNGVYGKAAGASSFGVLGQNTTGVAIKGTSAPTVSSVPAILGECTGTTGIGVEGNSNGAGGIGVNGESTSGTGVLGYSVNAGSVAVSGYSLLGTGVKAFSLTGAALDVNGNVKISGGNTNPSIGAVLTSDLNGNATWKNNRVAFGGSGINTDYYTLPEGVFNKVEFYDEEYDLQGNFVPTPSTANANTSVFTVPVSGIYNLNAQLIIYLYSSSVALQYTRMQIRLLRGGTSTIASNDGYVNEIQPTFDKSGISINSEFHLLAGDKVWLEVSQGNSGTANANVGDGSSSYNYCWFRGHLVMAD